VLFRSARATTSSGNAATTTAIADAAARARGSDVAHTGRNRPRPAAGCVVAYAAAAHVNAPAAADIA